LRRFNRAKTIENSPDRSEGSSIVPADDCGCRSAQRLGESIVLASRTGRAYADDNDKTDWDMRMRTHFIIFGLAAVSLAGCGSSVSTPEQLRGVWSDNCPSGMIQIDENQLHILYPKREDFDLTEANFDGKNLSLSFESDGKKITDVYVYDGKTLAIDHIITESGTFNSDKTPLTKCS
jgi:hypothetical protein